MLAKAGIVGPPPVTSAVVVVTEAPATAGPDPPRPEAPWHEEQLDEYSEAGVAAGATTLNVAAAMGPQLLAASWPWI
jgi:hypothetical protein